MTRLRICSDGPLLLADGRRAVLERREPIMAAGINAWGATVEWQSGWTDWQPVPIVDESKEDAP